MLKKITNIVVASLWLLMCGFLRGIAKWLFVVLSLFPLWSRR